jgi:hypothetical protein
MDPIIQKFMKDIEEKTGKTIPQDLKGRCKINIKTAEFIRVQVDRIARLEAVSANALINTWIIAGMINYQNSIPIPAEIDEPETTMESGNSVH